MLATAVGASVLEGAVDGFQSGSILPDEVPMSNPSGTTTSSGHTVGPDLESVTIVGIPNAFDVVDEFWGRYTFDEAVDTPVDGDFRLYDADGTELQCTNSVAGTVSAGTEKTITCMAYGTATADQVKNATIVTVDDTAVNASDSGPENVEGGSPTSRLGF